MTADGIKSLDDLTHLTHLHEASLLSSLNERFEQDLIYTFTGPILIAVNPFKMIPGIYDTTVLNHYIEEGYRQSFTAARTPHVFSTAADAYRGLCQNRTNQTVLISGESGAGKTESTKLVMRLLALAGSRGATTRSSVENQVLQSNPLLEAFGNAKTLRNDNSSRFGKFIEMQFDLVNNAEIGGTIGMLCGARIRTYLLETVRVCRQLKNERNYHAFYQIAAAASKAASNNGTFDIDRKRGLSLGVTDTFEGLSFDFRGFENLLSRPYVAFSGCHKLDRVDDEEEFVITSLAMTTMGINQELQQNIWNLTGAILLLGALSFEEPEGNTEASRVKQEDAGLLDQVAHFFGTTPHDLQKAVTTRSISVQKEVFDKPLTLEQAEDARDACARALYGTLFLSIVDNTNQSIGYVANVNNVCGVLDIFGFECFDVNSFEQLCINFTNERLQYFFNSFIFKCEEQLYREEQIPWDPLDFPDNQDCVQLLSGPRMSVFAMLDEECVIPKGTDLGYCNKLKTAHKDHTRFNIIKTKQDWFIINHFAGFLDKNRDQLSMDIQDVIKASKSSFISNLFHKYLDRSASDNKENAQKGAKRPVTVSGEFRSQLNTLIASVEITEPHFIRCVKPNPRNKPEIFHRKSVSEQLRYAGVLQAVQVSRAGYPVRVKHLVCWQNYKALLDQQVRQTLLGIGEKERAQTLLEKLNHSLELPPPKHGGKYSWAVGQTMVFLKHEAYEVLSTRRSQLSHQNSSLIRACWVGFIQRRWYQAALMAISMLQRGLRCYWARCELTKRREIKAATVIAKTYRMHVQRAIYLDTLRKIRICQGLVRGHLGRLYVSRLREHRAATRIQSRWRMHRCTCIYRQRRRRIITVQLYWKQKLAKRQLAQLRVQSRNAAGLAQEKARLQEQLRQLIEEMNEMRQQVAAREEEAVRLTEESARREAELAEGKLALEASKVSLESTRVRIENEKRQLEEEKKQLSAQNVALTAEIQKQMLRPPPSRFEDECETAVPSPLASSPPKEQGTGGPLDTREIDDVSQSSVQEESARIHNQELHAPDAAVSGETTDAAAGPESGGEGETETREDTVTGGDAQGSPIIKKATVIEEEETSSPSSEQPSPPSAVLRRSASLEEEITKLRNDLASLETESVRKCGVLVEEFTEERRNVHERVIQALRGDCSGYLNRVLDVVREDGGDDIAGDFLVIGEPKWAVASLIRPLKCHFDDLTESRLEDIFNEVECTSWKRRQVEVWLQTGVSAKFFLATKDEIEKKFDAAESGRLRRHFARVLFCVASSTLPTVEFLTELVETPLFRSFHIDVRQGVIGHWANSEVEAFNASLKVHPVLHCVRLYTCDQIGQLLPLWAANLQIKKQHLVDDLVKLVNATVNAPAKSPSKIFPMGRTTSQTTSTSVSEYVLSGIASIFGSAHRSFAKPKNTATAAVSDLLAASMSVVSTPSAKSPKNVSLAQWESFTVPNRTAVTCAKFARVCVENDACTVDASLPFYLLAAGTKGGLVCLYKVAKTELELEQERAHPAKRRPVRPRLYPDEENTESLEDWLAPPDQNVQLWKELAGHERAITSLLFDATGSQLVSTSIDCTVRFWDAKFGYSLKIFSDSVPILVASFLPTDPKFFLTGNSKSVVRIVNSELGTVTQRMKVESELRAVCFDTSGLNLIAGTKDGALDAYEVVENNRIGFLTRLCISSGSSRAPITCVKFCTGQPPVVLVNACDDSVVVVACVYSVLSVNIQNFVVKNRIKIAHNCIPLVSCLIKRDDFNWFVSGSEDTKIKLFAQGHNGSSFSAVGDLKGHENIVLSVDCNHKQTILASADVTGKIILWRKAARIVNA